ncbi:MAG: suppressor of fused domain protein [Ruminococcaceae bacterium]|nr:suppressor of fused domain protein [Oscillospiraceae bacterium]
MGIFDRFRKKKPENTPEPLTPDTAGWDDINRECERVYPGQTNPKHYGTLIKWCFGGNDPLDGISIYDGGDFWHFVTFGLSELYQKESDDKAVSGYGMEFTFRLKKACCEDQEAEIRCICGILQTIARITFTKGEVFRAYEYLYTGQTEGIDTKMASNITGFITIPDSTLNSIDTRNGRLDFVQFIGVTNAELLALREKQMTVKELYDRLGSDVTDYCRESVV